MSDPDTTPCPICEALCPIEKLDTHVEIIDCCNRKRVVRVDNKLTETFKNAIEHKR